MDGLLTAALSGAVCGLIAWGGIRADLRWLKERVEAAHARIDSILRENKA